MTEWQGARGRGERADDAGRVENEPPARRHAAAGREVVERVMLNLWSLPSRVDRAPITRSLEAAMAGLTKLEASDLEDVDHLDRVNEALAQVEDARRQLDSLGALGQATRAAKGLADLHGALKRSLDETVARLIRVQGMRLRAPPPPPAVEKPLGRPFRASVGLPNLHAFERDPLPPGIRVDAPDDDWDDEDDEDGEDDDNDDASGEESIGAHGSGVAGVAGVAGGSVGSLSGGPGATVDPGVNAAHDDGTNAGLEGLQDSPQARTLEGAQADTVELEIAHLRRIARDCMEELGSLGLLRAPEGPSVAWAPGPAGFEQRLLCSLDALVALAQPFQSQRAESRLDVLTALLDYSGDAFVPDPARAFARAFVLGSIEGDDTVRAAVIGLRQSHPSTYGAQRDALALAPSPAIGPAMQRLCAEGRPALTRVALDVLRLRWEATFEVVAPLLSHPDMGVRTSAARALAVVPSRDPARRILLQQLDAEEDDRVVVVLAESLLTLDPSAALAAVRARLEEEMKLAGSIAKGARLGLLRLLGIAGGPADAEVLLRSLDQSPYEADALGWFGHPDLVPALLAALTQSQGVASRWAFARALARALHRITGLAAQTGPDSPPVEVIEPPVDAGFWQAQWEAHKARFEVVQRYRFGRPFTPLATIDEALAAETLTEVRGECELELAMASSGASRFHVHDWVARQQAELIALRAYFTGTGRPGFAGTMPGEWPTARAPRLAAR